MDVGCGTGILSMFAVKVPIIALRTRSRGGRETEKDLDDFCIKLVDTRVREKEREPNKGERKRESVRARERERERI